MQDATEYAQKQSDAFRESLQYLIDEQNKQKLAAQKLINTTYGNTVNQINAQRGNITQDYTTGAEQAYVNKMLAGQSTAQKLSQMGLTNSGFGLSAQADVENVYSSNLNDLLLQKQAATRDLDTNIANVEAQKVAEIASTNLSYDDKLLALRQTINQQVDDKYNTAYQQAYNERAYQDQLKQQDFENRMTQANYNLNYQNTFGDNEPVDENVDNLYNTTATTQKSDYYFKNSNQPAYIGNIRLKSAGYVKDLFSSGEFSSLGNTVYGGQNIWTDGKDYYVWDNATQTYNDIGTLYWRKKNSSSNSSTTNKSTVNLQPTSTTNKSTVNLNNNRPYFNTNLGLYKLS